MRSLLSLLGTSHQLIRHSGIERKFLACVLHSNEIKRGLPPLFGIFSEKNVNSRTEQFFQSSWNGEETRDHLFMESNNSKKAIRSGWNN